MVVDSHYSLLRLFLLLHTASVQPDDGRSNISEVRGREGTCCLIVWSDGLCWPACIHNPSGCNHFVINNTISLAREMKAGGSQPVCEWSEMIIMLGQEEGQWRVSWWSSQFHLPPTLWRRWRPGNDAHYHHSDRR